MAYLILHHCFWELDFPKMSFKPSLTYIISLWVSFVFSQWTFLACKIYAAFLRSVQITSQLVLLSQGPNALLRHVPNTSDAGETSVTNHQQQQKACIYQSRKHITDPATQNRHVPANHFQLSSNAGNICFELWTSVHDHPPGARPAYVCCLSRVQMLSWPLARFSRVKLSWMLAPQRGSPEVARLTFAGKKKGK